MLFRLSAYDWLQKQWDALSILELGALHHLFQQQAQRIDQQVTLTSRELFAPIIAMQSASLRGFDRLAINNRCIRSALMNGCCSRSYLNTLHTESESGAMSPSFRFPISI